MSYRSIGTGLSVLMYYGADRQVDLRTLRAADVVVTSYGVLVSEAKKMMQTSSSGTAAAAGGDAELDEEASPRGGNILGMMAAANGLYGLKWHRVVLDEAHTIKNATTEVARACCLVQAERRWALTGTPIQNSLDDMFSLMKFLKHEPWDQGRWWKKTISDPHAAGDKRAMTVLRVSIY
jgi:DNA repair protein RAD5